MREVFGKFRTSKPKFLIIIIILLVPLFIIVGIILLWILGSFIFDYNHYVHKDINKIKYAEPTEEAKNFDLEGYIDNLPPVEYTKIDYVVKETLRYEFNGYILTMDIPEGMDYYEISWSKGSDNRIINSKNIEDSVDSYSMWVSPTGPGTDDWRNSIVISDKEICIKDEKKVRQIKYCPYLSITPIKSKYKGISMRDVYVYDLNHDVKNYYKYSVDELNFLVGDSASILLSDEQEIFIGKNKKEGFSGDIFFSMLDTVKIGKIKE